MFIKVQHGREPVDVDFCSITVDGGLDDDILQQRIHSIARQREELQHMETELRAQVIAGSEIMEIQKSFHAQIKEREDAAAKLQVWTFLSIVSEFFSLYIKIAIICNCIKHFLVIVLGLSLIEVVKPLLYEFDQVCIAITVTSPETLMFRSIDFVECLYVIPQSSF